MVAAPKKLRLPPAILPNQLGLGLGLLMPGCKKCWGKGWGWGWGEGEGVRVRVRVRVRANRLGGCWRQMRMHVQGIIGFADWDDIHSEACCHW